MARGALVCTLHRPCPAIASEDCIRLDGERRVFEEGDGGTALGGEDARHVQLAQGAGGGEGDVDREEGVGA
eukprot:scaffold12170_cov180-Isochrysis_galbana.AAC.1